MEKRVKVLQGEKVSLWVLERTDSELWYQYMNDLEVQQFLNVAGVVLSREAEEAFYEITQKDPNLRIFAILTTEERNIWNISLSINQKNRNAELGIVIFDKNYWGKGYGTESMQLLLHYGFDILGLHKIYLNYISYNQRGARVYEKVGFKIIWTRKEHRYYKGSYHDMIEMEILKFEYDLLKTD